jgi:hypothetical protein
LPFFKAIQGILASPWSTAETDLVYPKTRGRRPDDFKQRLQYYGALLRISCEDVDVQRTMNLVGQLMAPATLLREPALAERVNAALAAAQSEAVN